MRPPDWDGREEIRPPIGGLQTAIPAALVRKSQSPDLLNVLHDRFSVRRREGCAPINRYLLPKNSIVNRGKTFTGQQNNDPWDNRIFKAVAGYGIAGHRPHLNTYNAIVDEVVTTTLTVSLLVFPEPDGDEVSESANWFSFNQDPAGTAAETYVYRPIFSKGPIRGTRYAEDERLAWSLFVINVGGLPAWGAYIQQAGNAAPVLLVSNTAKTTTTCPPRPHHTYRLTLTATGSSAGGTAKLIIAELNGDGTVTRETVTEELTTALWTNSGPLMWFDAPQAMFEATNAEGGLEQEDGYLLNVLRFEGRWEDCGIWAVDKSADIEFLESFSPTRILPDPGIGIAPAANDENCSDAGGGLIVETVGFGSVGSGNGYQPPPIPYNPIPPSPGNPSPSEPHGVGLIAHWAPLTLSEVNPDATAEENQTIIPEDTGKDLPILFGPTVPCWNRVNGKESLYFDGRTSYAVMPTAIGMAIGSPPSGGDENINYVLDPLESEGNNLETMVVDEALGGEGARVYFIAVTAIPDSVEPKDDNGTSGTEAEAQCIFCWAGVVKFGISTRGNLWYAPFSDDNWATTIFTTFYLTPGVRYSILYRRTTGATADISVNLRLIDEATGLTIPVQIDGGLPAFILGTEDVGVFDHATPGMRWTSKQFPRGTWIERHFLGRIEDVRIGGGEIPLESALLTELNEDDLFLDSAQIWSLAAANAFSDSFRAPSGTDGMWFHSSSLQTALLEQAPFYGFVLQRLLGIDSTASASNTFRITFRAAPEDQPDGINAAIQLHARISHYLAWWDFNVPSLGVNLESRYLRGREYVLSQTYIYEQAYAVPDRLAASFPMLLRSRQVDDISTATHLWPWDETTPMEVKPRFGVGLVPARVGGNPVSLIAQLDDATIVSAGVGVYWLKPCWDRTTPYSLLNDPHGTSFFASGRLRNHIEIPASTAWDMSIDGLTIEFWIKVPELGRYREVALNWDGAASNAFNWRVVLTAEGGIQISGYRSGPLYWTVGTIQTGLNNGFSPILPNRWRHVAITLHCDTAGSDLIANDQIFIDGEAQQVETPVGNHATGWVGGGGRKWIAGHAHHLGPARAIATEAVMLEPLLGHLRDFRVTRGVRYTGNFIRPQRPLPEEAATISLLPLNDGADLATICQAGTHRLHGTIRNHEALPILDYSLLANNSIGRPYDWTVYQGTLYITNGLGPPMAIRFDRLSDYRATRLNPLSQWFVPAPYGFRVNRMGITPPTKDPPTLTGRASGTSGFLEDTTYRVAVTFTTYDGLESDPVEYFLPVGNDGGAGTHWEYLELVGLPRSFESHVTARRVYVGVVDPTRFVTRKGHDNLSNEIEITNNSGGVVSFQNGAPPPAKFLAIHRGRGYLAQGSIVHVSAAIAIESYPATQQLLLDSGGGFPIVGLKEYFGRIYGVKRDSVFQIVPGANIQNFTLYRLNTQTGFTGAFGLITNALVGASERGIYVFDGSGMSFISDALDAVWATLDIRHAQADHFRMAYLEATEQLWISVRRIGEAFGREMVCLDLGVRDPETDAMPWSLHRTVQHSYLAVVTDGGLSRMLVGSPDGQVFEFLVGGADGSRQVGNTAFPHAPVPFVLSGLAAGGSASTLTISASGAAAFGLVFDTLGHGLRGLYCRIYRASTGEIHEARIIKNTTTTLTFEGNVPWTVVEGDAFAVGGYRAHWSSGWLALSGMDQEKKIGYVDVDFAPNLGDLTVRSLEAGISAGAGMRVPLEAAFRTDLVVPDYVHPVPQSSGYHPQPLPVTAGGFYHRVDVGTDGVDVPFEIYGLVLHFDERGPRKGMAG